MPRTTGPQRVKYAAIAVEMRKELGDREPYHSHRERKNSRLAQRAGCVDLCPYSKESDGLSRTLLTIEQWLARWRSCHGYDGPPTRAPSGVEFHYRIIDDGFGVLQVPLRVHTNPESWPRHIEGLEPSQEPDYGRVSERGVVKFASWCMENFNGWGAIPICFDPPSKGGRGWCPALAGVGK